MNKFWNGKMEGLPHAVSLFLGAVFHKVRYKLSTCFYKWNLAKCGNNVILMPSLRFRYPKTIEIGNGVVISGDVELSRGEIESGRLIIEDGASIDKGSFIDYSGSIIIRRNAHIAKNVYISTHNHGYDYRNVPIGKSLEIGENAFVGAKSIILFNCCRIGNHAVVGAGSVVTKDVPDNAIVAGNPAKIIKFRNM